MKPYLSNRHIYIKSYASLEIAIGITADDKCTAYSGHKLLL